jgi:hypothetical protein
MLPAESAETEEKWRRKAVEPRQVGSYYEKPAMDAAAEFDFRTNHDLMDSQFSMSSLDYPFSIMSASTSSSWYVHMVHARWSLLTTRIGNIHKSFNLANFAPHNSLLYLTHIAMSTPNITYYWCIKQAHMNPTKSERV